MPGMKEWLDSQILEGWIKGLQDRCKSHERLRGTEDVVIPALRNECQALTERHMQKRTDSRSATHIQVLSMPPPQHKVLAYTRECARIVHAGFLKRTTKRCRCLPTAHYELCKWQACSQVASLVLATHKVLMPYVRNESEVMEMLKEQNGAKSEQGIRCACLRQHANGTMIVQLSAV